MQKNKFSLIAVVLVFAIFSCQTKMYVIPESMLSAKEHRKAIVVAFGDPRLLSQNGREVYSHYHDKKFIFVDEPTNVDTRYVTKITILGARRPYDVAVEVRTERKDPGSKQFLDTGLDDSLSQKRLQELRKVLNQSRENSQEFDVENPF